MVTYGKFKVTVYETWCILRQIFRFLKCFSKLKVKITIPLAIANMIAVSLLSVLALISAPWFKSIFAIFKWPKGDRKKIAIFLNP